MGSAELPQHQRAGKSRQFLSGIIVFKGSRQWLGVRFPSRNKKVSSHTWPFSGLPSLSIFMAIA